MEELIIDSNLDSKQNHSHQILSFFSLTLIRNVRSFGATGTNKGALTKPEKRKGIFGKNQEKNKP